MFCIWLVPEVGWEGVFGDEEGCEAACIFEDVGVRAVLEGFIPVERGEVMWVGEVQGDKKEKVVLW